jgi:hypothetical protein
MGIIYFKKHYQCRTSIVKNGKGDLVTDSRSILVRWRNHFSELFNVHGVSDIRQTEIHTAEPLVPELSAFEFEKAVERLKRHIMSIDLIPVEQFAVRSQNLRLKCIWNKEELLD